MDMVRGMPSNSQLPKYLWTEALKMDVYILNEFQSRLSQSHLLSYLKVGNRVCDIYTYGVARLK